MENPIKMDDFGGTPILGNIHLVIAKPMFYILY